MSIPTNIRHSERHGKHEVRGARVAAQAGRPLVAALILALGVSLVMPAIGPAPRSGAAAQELEIRETDARAKGGGSGAGAYGEAAGGAAGDMGPPPIGAAGGGEPVVIEAEATEYHYGGQGTIIEARGDVRVTHGDLRVSADYLRVDVASGELLARGNVLVRRGTAAAACSEFSYDMETGDGRMLEPSMSVPGLGISGKELLLASGELTIKAARATGCDLEDPCYRITSRRTVIYPDRRITADWPVLWLGHVPVMMVPRLSIPLRGERVGWVDGEGYPVPRLSYDPENGFSVGASYLDRSRGDLVLRYDGAYVSRPGGAQVEVRADASPGSGVAVTLAGGLRTWEGPYGSAVCKLDVAPSSIRAGAQALSLTVDARYRSGASSEAGLQGGATALADLGRLALSASVRKAIPTTGAVYSLPSVDASLGPLAFAGAQVTFAAGLGRFEEPERAAESTRSYAALSVSAAPVEFSLSTDAAVRAELRVSARRAWYGTGETAGSVRADIDVKGEFGNVESFGADVPRVVAGVGYARTLISGSSPFAFDAIEALNEVTSRLTVRLAPSWTAEVSSSYDMEARALDDLDFSLTNHHHCYDVAATWREKRQEFGLEIRFTR